jgi:large subunit ribosomal protein L10
MTREEKALLIEELANKFAQTDYFYIVDASGFTVAQINDLRRACFKAGVEYKVAKNTLIRKALEKSQKGDLEAFNEKVLKGYSAVMFASEEAASAPAKIIKEYRKKNKAEKPILKGAYIDSDTYIGDAHLETLASLKSKQELLGEIIGLLQSPAQNVISALQGQGQKIAGILKTLEEKAAS